ncbi:cell envelope integrity protein CreD [Terriglobus aquaticus]
MPGGSFGVGPRLDAISRGLKFLVVCGLALLMSLMALFVAWLTEDRSTRAASVRQELSAEAGGPQMFLGPVVLVPYTEPNADPKQPARESVFVFAPSVGKADVVVQAEERRRSLYRVPVIRSEVTLESDFQPEDLRAVLPAHATADWSRAAIAIGVSNARAALSDGVLETKDGPARLGPIELQHVLAIDAPAENARGLVGGNARALTVLGVNAAHLQSSGAFQVKARLNFSGAERVTLLAYGRTTAVTMQGNWADPGFTGPVLPQERSVTKRGFAARWSVPSMARTLGGVVDVTAMGTLGETAMTTELVEVADAYQSVERALKYAPLFLALVFLSYFLFEVTAGRPVHVAQYVLVGVAQLVFYLLLLSFAERIGFDLGFLLGGVATVLLLGLNAGWVFRSERERWRALVIFSALYAMIYGLLRMEDNALLLGALGSFAAIAAAMFWTRGLDWYGGESARATQGSHSADMQTGA